MGVHIAQTKIFKSGDVFCVVCHRTGKEKPATKCKDCIRYINIDPVKSEIKCREW
jgi:hypothetical protein